MRTVDLNRIAVFASVVDAGGVTAAAAVLGLPKSSVSRSVTLLEDELGVTLLTRSPRGSTMTEAGRAFYAAAARALGEVEDARHALVGVESAPRGVVRIAAPVDIGSWVLMPIVARFRETHPQVEVDVRLTQRPLDGGPDSFDLALHRGRTDDETLDSRVLGSQDSALYAAPSYLARRGTPTSGEELAGHDCILLGVRGARERWTLIRESDDATITVEPTGPVRVDGIFGVRAAVEAGLGIAPLPIPGAAGAEGVLTRVLPGTIVRGEPLRLVWARARHTPRRVALLRDAIADSVSRVGPNSAREAGRGSSTPV